MRYFRPLIVALLFMPLPACAAVRPAGEVIAKPTRDWRGVATGADRERLREWRTAFTKALAKARSTGHGAEIDREGVLLEPDAALGGPPIPNGTYNCRVIKLGAKSEGMLDYVAYPAFNCRIRQEKELQAFAKLTGSQRHAGLIFPGDQLRQVMLGTLILGDETRAMQYGRDTDRDVAGFVERIGPNRWRLVLPYPHFESLTDFIELTPAP
jgi:hypothetical protein